MDIAHAGRLEMKGDTQSVLCEEQEEHSRTEFGLFFRLLGVLWFRFQVREKMSWREELMGMQG